MVFFHALCRCLIISLLFPCFCQFEVSPVDLLRQVVINQLEHLRLTWRFFDGRVQVDRPDRIGHIFPIRTQDDNTRRANKDPQLVTKIPLQKAYQSTVASSVYQDYRAKKTPEIDCVALVFLVAELSEAFLQCQVFFICAFNRLFIVLIEHRLEGS